MRTAIATALLLSCSAPALAQVDPAAAFGTRESVEQISLSPDGSKIAFVAPDKTRGERSTSAMSAGRHRRSAH